MKRADYILGVLLLSSPFLIGAAIWAVWSPEVGVLAAFGAVVGSAWVLAMAHAAKGN